MKPESLVYTAPFDELEKEGFFAKLSSRRLNTWTQRASPSSTAKNVKLAFYNERMKRRLQVLDGIDLKLFEGELVAIVGLRAAASPHS